MSTATATLDAGRDHRPGLVQLTTVELRKMYDTRSGFWLLISGVLLALAVALITVLTGSDDTHTLANLLDNCTQAITVLLPVVGILLVTSEWSQRTALLTFTLVPQRGRVLAAKLAASMILAVIALVVALAVSAICTAINPASVDAWHLDGALLFQTLVFTMLSMLGGFALGAAILVSAPAIVALFVLGLAYTAITHIIGGLDGLARWTDQAESWSAMTDHALSSTEWARVGVTALLWCALPLAIGTYRFLRGEIR
jgi:ABC-2 type transport system permease protein